MKKTKTFRFIKYFLFFQLLLGVTGTSLNAQSCTLLSSNINLGGPSHDPGYQSSDAVNTAATLSNGNFVVAWETRDGVDGSGNGAFFQVFKEDGGIVTGVIMPYADINPTGTGEQGVFGPKIIALQTGFAIAWESEDGPGDTGPAGDDQQDVFFRVYNNDGSPLAGSTRISIAAQEDHLEYLLPLSTGGFVLLMRIDEDVAGNNSDDYFFQAFNASGVPASAGLTNISSSAHDLAFQSTDAGHPMLDLGNGTFVVTWEARDDIDGNGTGGFFRIFNSNGTPITGVIMPYSDINPAGTGNQGTPGPTVTGLANGNFVVSWESEQGPGDIGLTPDDLQDVYFRVYSANGAAVTGTMKANSDNAVDEEKLDGTIGLKDGNFAILYHRDEDDTGNKDDFFVRTFTPGGIAAGASLEISSGAHVNAFCVVLENNKEFVALNNGNFAVGWAAWDASDGDGDGAYYRVFSPSGTAISAVTLPYADINPAGTGNQSALGPILKALPDGFTVAWESEQGPGDVGPAPDGQQDIYHRVIDNSGVALCGSTKTNTSNDAEEEILVAVQALANGNFAVVYRDDEDDTGNLDDYFVRVIGGAPLQNVCPALGTVSVSAPAVCIGNPFNLTVNGLQNMAESANNEQNYGIKLVAFANATSNPYTGGTLLGAVAFGNLTSGGTAASLTGITISMADPDLFIYAILDAVPGDPACIPFAQTMIAISAFPVVAFTAPADICISAGVLSGLGGGTPAGGEYSGPGVSNDGNGLTYSFDHTIAGAGTHTITYNFTNAGGCGGTASDNVVVLAAPVVSISLPDTIFVTNGMPPLNVPGGGLPVGGVYSDMFNEAVDDGNGLTFSFLSNFLVGDFNTITYSYTDNNGCSNSAFKTIFVANATVGIDDLEILQVKVFPNPTAGKINVQGVKADRIEVTDTHGRILSVVNHPGPILDISNLPGGIYFLRLMVEDQMIVERIVKE